MIYSQIKPSIFMNMMIHTYPISLQQNVLSFFLLFLICMKTGTLAGSESSAMMRCIESERQALLMLGKRENEKDCCKWEGVGCSNRSGHITMLDIRYMYAGFDIKVENLGWLSNLSSLTYLDMGGNNLSSSIHLVDIIKRLPSLSYLSLTSCELSQVTSPFHSLINSSSTSIATLDLSLNYFTSSMFQWLFNLTSSTLVHLDLFYNQLEGPIPDAFGNITSLAYLDLSWNQLEGTIPDAFGNIISLAHLDLSNNHLEGVIPNSFRNLCNLQILDLSHNKLDGFFPKEIGQCSALVQLDLSANQIKGPLPDFTGRKSLTELYLGQNEFNGTFPDFTGCTSLTELFLDSNRISGTLSESIGQLSKLEYLTVSSNSLEGVISQVHLFNLTSLKTLDLSLKSLSLELSTQWVPPFQLDDINLTSCKLGPQFPRWIQTQTSFSSLDFSNCGISDTVPVWFWNLSTRLDVLNLSFNKIRGLLPNLQSIVVQDVDLSSNNFEGPIPLFPSGLTSLNLSGNKFSGALTFLCAISDGYLVSLDLSHNLLSGGLPDCWEQFLGMVILNLAHNRLSGKIPSSMGYLISLQSLDLENNSFSGELPSSLRNCTMLYFLDLGRNKLAGKVPAWIGEDLSQLYILILRANNFYGSIPLHICHLTNLQLLDLSMNLVSGPIPQCFNNFTGMVQERSPYEFSRVSPRIGCNPITGFGSTYDDSALIGWKGRDLDFGKGLRLVKGIDLSSNKLTGELPEAMTSLLEMVALNLSRNKLYGILPPKIDQLKSLESLDLSRNNFSGGIPASMSELNFLSYFDLAYNNFSGRIPLGTQLQSFGASQYTGNKGLCGPPLTPKCPGDEAPQVPHTIGVVNEDEDEFHRCFYISMALGFVIGFWGICGTLLLNHQRRHAYFIILDNLENWLYVTAAVHIAKLNRDDNRNQ